MNLVEAIRHIPIAKHNRKCPACGHSNFRYAPRKRTFCCHGCGARFPKSDIVRDYYDM